MFARLVLFALIAMLPATAFAKPAKPTATVTCMRAIDAADKAGLDWTTSGGADSLYYIDGAGVANLDQLRDALIAAKQKIPFISGGNFSGWDFRNQLFAISGTCFYNSDLSKSRWDDVDLFGSGFIKSNLGGAMFNNAKIENILLRDDDLTGAKMRYAKLSNGRVDGGWEGIWTNWDLTGADMSGFVFDCGITIDDGCTSERSGVNFNNASLRGADISTAPFWAQATFNGAIFMDSSISPRQLVDVNAAIFNGNNILRGGDASISLDMTQMMHLVKEAVAGAADADHASFDCAKASGTVEKSICGEYGSNLRHRDRQLADLYSYIRPKNPAIAPSQKAWIAARAKCKDDGCIAEKYEQRINELALMLGEVEILPRGQSALFINPETPFLNSFKDDPLYIKVTPALVGASWQEVVLSRAKDGSYSINGEAVGANAHLCDISADGARYNPETGWFSIQDVPVFRMIGDDLTIVGDGHPDETQYPGADQYVSCGARAYFGPMQVIKVDAKLLKAEEKAFAAKEG